MNSTKFANYFFILLMITQLIGIFILYQSWKHGMLIPGLAVVVLIYGVSFLRMSRIKVYDDKGKEKNIIDMVFSIAILFLLSLGFYILFGTYICYKLSNHNTVATLIPLMNAVCLISGLLFVKVWNKQ
jgi:hypothetical protein